MADNYDLSQPNPNRFVDSITTRDTFAQEQELATLREQLAQLRKYINCGGAPTDKICRVDGHQIYGGFFTDGEDCICELHGFREQINSLQTERDQARADLNRAHADVAKWEENWAEAVKRGDQALAELAECKRDSERLDWLIANQGVLMLEPEGIPTRCYVAWNNNEPLGYFNTPREAINVAMATEDKPNAFQESND